MKKCQSCGLSFPDQSLITISTDQLSLPRKRSGNVLVSEQAGDGGEGAAGRGGGGAAGDARGAALAHPDPRLGALPGAGAGAPPGGGEQVSRRAPLFPFNISSLQGTHFVVWLYWQQRKKM